MHVEKIIRHRVNTINELSLIDKAFGVELDLRNNDDAIILNHDPFKTGDSFEEYLQNYKHSTCILNTKADGLEEQSIALMEKYAIENYFFLDTTVPTMVKYIKKGFSKLAVRFSEYEPLSFVQQFESKVDWVWVYCFSKNVLSKEAYSYLKKHFKVCIVSPELQAHSLEWIEQFKQDFKGFELDAVCTKRPELWK